MANINTELEQIRKAVYGREVRGSIANAIELINKEQINTSTAQTNLDSKFNQLIINAGNSNAEVVASRVKADGTQFSTLGKRLDSFDSELDNIKSNSIISFIFDDGFVEDNKTYELFKSKNMLCNFALVKDWTKALNKNFVDNYRKYQNEGFGILSHTSTHADLRNSGISQYNAEYEIAKSLELNKYDFRISGFVAAQSSIHEDYMHFVEQNYDFAFTRYRGVLSGDKKGHYSKKEDVHRLWRISIESNSLEDLKTCIDNCISEKGFLVLYGHQLDTTTGLTTKKLTALLDYINNLDCEVLNIYNAMSKYFGININNETGFDESKYVNILNISNNNGLSSELSFNKLFLYNHDDDKGDNVVINGNRITLGYTSELSEGKVTTLQGKISLSDVDMNYIENQCVILEADIYTNSINFDNIDFTVECRFFDSVKDGDHILHCNLNKSSRKIRFISTPFSAGNKNYLQFIFRTTFKGNCDANTKIHISNFKISKIKSLKKDIVDVNLANQDISTLNSNILLNLGAINIDEGDLINTSTNEFKLTRGKVYKVSLVLNSDTILDSSTNTILTLFEGKNVVKRVYPILVAGTKPYILFECILRGDDLDYNFKINTSKSLNINTYSYLSIYEL